MVETEKRSYAVLKDQKQYLKMIGANVVNRYGDSLDAVAFSWIAYRITQSASLMALIIAVNFIPTIVLQPIAGVFVDKIRKKRVMVVSDIGRGLVVLAIALLYLAEKATPAVLFAGTLLNSTLEAFRVPAGLGIVPKLLDRDKYTVGTALNSTLGRICEIVGLATAGSVIALVGSHGALIIDAVTFMISALIIATLRVKEDPVATPAQISAVAAQFKEGLVYVKARPLLVAILVLGMFMNFGMVPLSSLSTPFIVENLKAGPQMLSAVQLALVAGMALGSFFTPKLDKIRRKPLFISSGVVAAGVSAALMWVPALPAGLVQHGSLVGLLGVMGVAIGIQNVLFSAAFMRHVERDILGRVGGLTNAVLCAAMPLGALLCSLAARFLPVPTVFLVSGVFSLALYAVMTRVKVLDEL